MGQNHSWRRAAASAALLAMASTGCGYEDQALDGELLDGELVDVDLGQTRQRVTGHTNTAWSDEFNGSSLDTSIWTYNTEAYFNGELQHYVDAADAATYNIVEVSGGTLKIHARHYPTSFWSPARNAQTNYRSARLITKNKKEVLYGSIEARLRMASNFKDGLWPAFWMLGNRISEAPTLDGNETVPWPLDGANEVDIWEWASKWDHEDSNLIAGNGAGSYSPFPGWPKSVPLDVSNFHVWKLEWSPTNMSLYRDATLLGSAPPNTNTANGFSDHMYVLLNLAVGGALGGAVDPSMTWPQTLEVDYVRFTPEGGGGGGGAVPIPAKLEAEDNSNQFGLLSESCTDVGGGENLGWADAGDFLEFEIDVPSGGSYSVDIRHAGANSAGNARIQVDGTTLDTVSLGGTSGWQAWETRSSAAFNMAAGTHTLRVQLDAGSMNINWVEVKSGGGGGATCSDGIQNQGETGVDCGGPCAACGGGGGGGCSLATATSVTGGNTGNFNTQGSVCYKTADTINGWGCSNFEGRTVSVNGTGVTCGAGISKSGGYYLFDASAGDLAWASIYWW